MGLARRRLTAILTGAALFLPVAAAAPAAADDAQASSVAISIKVSDKVKEKSGCWYLVWNVTASGLNSSDYYSLGTKVTNTKTNKSVTGYLAVSGGLKNGENRVRAYVCASSFKAGPYKAVATVKVSGKRIATATGKTFKVTGKPTVGITNGYSYGNDPFYMYGYADPSVDTVGSTVKVYFKKNGASKFTQVATAKVQASGKYEVTTSKITLGVVYVQTVKTTYLSAATSPKVKIVQQSGSVSPAAVIGG
ncbi:hypothetical protein [Cellulomonas composti]|nr:hypothetical protein [Cellulomonas composti]